MGHNGAGKSTLINVLCGLVFKDQGNARIFDSSIEDDLRQVWRGDNQNILIEPQQSVDVPSMSSSECRKFEFTFEEQGVIKRGSGVACKDANKNWRMLGSEML